MMSWLTDLFKSDAAKKAKAALQTEIDAYKPRVLSAIDETADVVIGSNVPGAVYKKLQTALLAKLGDKGVPALVLVWLTPYINAINVSMQGDLAQNIRREAERLKKEINGARL